MSPVAPSSVELEPAPEWALRKIAERDAQNEALRKRNAELSAELTKLRREFTAFRNEVKRLLGHVPNSKHLIEEGQLSLFDGIGPEELAPEETPEHANEAPDGETNDDSIRGRDKPKKRAKKTDTSVLPREEVVHDLEQHERVCPETGVQLVKIGVEIFEELDYVAAKLRVIEHHQIVYGAPPEIAEERQIASITAPLPARPLEGCKASASLLAYLLIQKYLFHLPLYRQEEAFQQAGLFIARSTLCDWVLKAAFALNPIACAIEEMIRAGPVLQLDDTPIKCQAGKGQGNFQAYLWSFTNPSVSGVAFRFTEGRSTADLAPILAGARASILLGDGYAANKSAAREAGLDVEYAGCWAHVLRKFRDAAKEAPSMVRLYRDDLRAIYAVEADAKERGLDADARARLRQEQARPVIARLMARTLGWKENFSLSGKMAEAIKYLRNSRRALTTYLTNGATPIDNNACERSIRPIAVGRRNWLFAGSVSGGEAAATIYTLIESCKAADVDPAEYVADMLVRVTKHPASRIQELVPSQWMKLQAANQAS
jgi:transposase